MVNVRLLADLPDALDSAAANTFLYKTAGGMEFQTLEYSDIVGYPTTGIDSAGIISLIDSNHISTRVSGGFDVANFVDSGISSNITKDSADATVKLGNYSKGISNLYLDSSSLFTIGLHNFNLSGNHLTFFGGSSSTDFNPPAPIYGLQNVTGYEVTQTAYNYGHTVHQSLILNDDGNIFDSSGLRSASTLPSASWNSAYTANPSTYFGADFDNYAQDLGYPSTSGGYHYLYSHSTANVSMSLTWSSGGVTVKHFFISGNNTNGYNYFAGGTVKFYINGVKESTARNLTAFPSPYDTTNTFYLDLSTIEN